VDLGHGVERRVAGLDEPRPALEERRRRQRRPSDAPAIGWPPTKRASPADRAASRGRRLTLPTSVTVTAPGSAARRAIHGAMASTGHASTTTSQAGIGAVASITR
jgi:hypothetical protein